MSTGTNTNDYILWDLQTYWRLNKLVLKYYLILLPVYSVLKDLTEASFPPILIPKVKMNHT